MIWMNLLNPNEQNLRPTVDNEFVFMLPLLTIPVPNHGGWGPGFIFLPVSA